MTREICRKLNILDEVFEQAADQFAEYHPIKFFKPDLARKFMGQQRIIIFILTLLGCCAPLQLDSVVAQQPADQLTAEMQQLDLSDLPPREQVRIQLEFAKQLIRLNKVELADSIQSEMAAFAQQQDDPGLYVQLFDHANRLFQFKRAQAYAAKTGMDQSLPAKKMIIEQVRSGDLESFEKTKLKFDDFFMALNLAGAMVEIGDYDAVNKFVSNVTLANDTNDVREIPAFAFRDIAEKFHEQGDKDSRA